jgi:hypothetical protein
MVRLFLCKRWISILISIVHFHNKRFHTTLACIFLDLTCCMTIWAEKLHRPNFFDDKKNLIEDRSATYWTLFPPNVEDY